MDFDLYDDLLVGDKEAEPTEREKLLTQENESLKVSFYWPISKSYRKIINENDDKIWLRLQCHSFLLVKNLKVIFHYYLSIEKTI